jgi:4-diphosphocytidyl-2-C-methyl-D-erythritol kinase
MSSGRDRPVVRTERAHAKINLVLRILAREASGYHAIETLFQRLALHDLVRVALTDTAPELRCHGPAMPRHGLGAVEQNLAWRAADAYVRAAKWQTGWTIEIEKHIPVGGGLGGGSADAAAVLRALDAMCPTPLGSVALLAIAGTLGADVPFLVSNAALAWAWGRGDRFLPLPTLPSMPVTLVAFREGVNTGRAYGAFAAERERTGGAVVACQYPEQAFASWPGIAALAGNDFEPVVSTLHGGVRAVLPVLRAQSAALRLQGAPSFALMSGSGATCFVLHAPGTRVVPDLPDGCRLVETATA